MGENARLGWMRMMDAINGTEDPSILLNGLFASRNTNADLISGAISCLVDCYRVSIEKGVRVQLFDKTMHAFMAGTSTNMRFELCRSLNAVDGRIAGLQVSELVSAIHAMRLLGCRWSHTRAEPQPLPVRVVGMPERVTITDVVRAAGTNQITGSKQVVTDAVV
jgi:hypothetical protein